MIQVNIPLLFNIVSIGIGLCGTIAMIQNQPWQLIQYYNRTSCCLSTLYFSCDIYNEHATHKRYIYIPHHIFSLIFSYKFFINNEVSFIRITPLLLLCGEGTSFISNIRLVLKKRKCLTTSIDTIFFVIYTTLRNGVITPILYYNRENNQLIWYSWISVLCMSNAWGLLWAKSILRYYRKTQEAKLQ